MYGWYVYNFPDSGTIWDNAVFFGQDHHKFWGYFKWNTTKAELDYLKTEWHFYIPIEFIRGNT